MLIIGKNFRFLHSLLTQAISKSQSIPKMLSNGPERFSMVAAADQLVHTQIQLALNAFGVTLLNIFRIVMVEFRLGTKIFICVPERRSQLKP